MKRKRFPLLPVECCSTFVQQPLWGIAVPCDERDKQKKIVRFM